MIKEAALKMFGSLVEPYLDYFDSLKQNLKRGSIKYTLKEYLSIILFSSFVAFAFTLIGGAALFTFIIPSGPTTIFYTYTTAFITAAAASAGVFALGYYYPSIKTNSLKSRIEKSLPFAVFYMATASSAGINPVDIFKLIADRGGIIGNEARRIYFDVTSLGMSLTTAIHAAASRSPSPLFSDLLYGMASVITSGGDLEDYLKGKTRTFMSQYRRTLDEYSDRITLYTEIYITLVIVGSLFFIILIAIIGPLVGGSTLFLQTFIIFFMVPLVSTGYLMLLRSMSPIE